MNLAAVPPPTVGLSPDFVLAFVILDQQREPVDSSRQRQARSDGAFQAVGGGVIEPTSDRQMRVRIRERSAIGRAVRKFVDKDSRQLLEACRDKNRTTPGNLSAEAKVASNESIRLAIAATAFAATSSTTVRNGCRTVTCAGTPRAAVGSCASR